MGKEKESKMERCDIGEHAWAESSWASE